jgi:hypothetical protein
MTSTFTPPLDLAHNLIAEQFPEYADLPVTDFEKQGNISRYCHSRAGGNPEQKAP